jgi:opacity protein-like surface antigen
MMRKLATPILTLVAFSLALPAFGQTYDYDVAEDIELNAFFGISAWTSNEFKIGLPQASPPINGKFNLLKAWRPGVRFNVYNNGRWGEEFYFSYENNRFQYLRGASFTSLPIQIYNFGFNTLYYLDPDLNAKLRPFLTFGLGATVYKPTEEAEVDAEDPAIGNLPGFGQSNEFSFNYGVGFKQRLNKRVGFRMDLKHFIGRNPSFSMSRHSNNPSEPVFPNVGAINNLEVTAGLVFYFVK